MYFWTSEVLGKVLEFHLSGKSGNSVKDGLKYTFYWGIFVMFNCFHVCSLRLHCTLHMVLLRYLIIHACMYIMNEVALITQSLS